ncbi:MAG TPA: DNA repair protein RecN [Opitutae bacterium]|nr:DNA repair protein RecN [Opitutaceae bacterium]HCR30521.1 DNA repair protein RecN [Opitutae bacterium]
MLQYLTISNLALLESASIEFDEGFTVVTGETGAGKSVFLGALSLLSGSRSDKTVIRSGEEQCEVEAALKFEDPTKINEALKELGLPECEDGVLLLKRSLRATKASRISINGSLATLANLQALGSLWIDFHGPGEPQRLLKNECQLEMIDLFARLHSEAEKYRMAYDDWKRTLSEIERLRNTTKLTQDQIEFLKQQIDRIDALELSPESVEQLEIDFNRVASSQDLIGLSIELGSGLTGDNGVVASLSSLMSAAKEAAEMDTSLGELAGRLEGVILEIQELGAEYEMMGSSLDFEPEFAEQVQSRMTDWQDFRRKYGRDVADVLEAREEMARKIDSQGDIKGALDRLHEKADEREADLKAMAAGLTRKRKKGGEELARKAEAVLLELGFKKGKCGLDLVKQSELKSYGDALPELLFSPNVGEPLKPLNKVASSGELARVMLALKTILANVDSVPILVFDEVDANVGGEIGKMVGQRLKGIGNNHQVVCITHLPQVAALGDNHFVVEKDQSGDRATVCIEKLNAKDDSRVVELARMLGDREAGSALSHAKELLAENAQVSIES